MSWPWISRQDAEDRYAQYAEQVAALQSQLSASQQKYDALLVSHLAYLVPTKTESTSAIAPERKPSKIAQTIREHAAGDTRLAAWLWDKARDLKAEGKDEAYIVERLTEWDSTEPEE